MRGVTSRRVQLYHGRDISTRTPHAGSDSHADHRRHRICISTRTPHAGSDALAHVRRDIVRQFQPALPMRGVTLYTGENNPHLMTISTRTPHAGSDAEPRAMRYRRLYFNPHSPCGE